MKNENESYVLQYLGERGFDDLGEFAHLETAKSWFDRERRLGQISNSVIAYRIVRRTDTVVESFEPKSRKDP